MNQRYYMGSGETRTGDFRKQAGLGSALKAVVHALKPKAIKNTVAGFARKNPNLLKNIGIGSAVLGTAGASATGGWYARGLADKPRPGAADAASTLKATAPHISGAEIAGGIGAAASAAVLAAYLAYKMRKKKEEDKYVKSDSASGQMMEHAASFGDIKIPWTDGAKAYLAEEKAKAIAKREANRRAEQLAIQNTDTLKPGRLTLLDRLNRLEETVSDKSKDVYGKVVNLIRDSKKKHTGASHGLYMHPLGDEHAASYGDIKSKSPFIAGIVPKLNPEDYKLKLPSQSNSYPSSSSVANQSVAAGSEAGKQNPDSLGAELDNAIRRIKEQSRSFASNHGTALKVGGGVAAGLLLAYMLRSMTPKKKKRRYEEAY